MKYLTALFSLLLVAGCASAAPPSGVERAIYSVVTNWHTQIVPVAVFGTNGGIVATNYLTNFVATYDLTPKESVVTTIQAGGTIGTMLGFGPSGVIATLILGALSAWAGWRSKRKGMLNTTLGQNLETSFNVVGAQPGGASLVAKLKNEVISQQVEGGVKKIAAEVHDNQVNPGAAKESAERVMKPSPSDSLPLP